MKMKMIAAALLALLSCGVQAAPFGVRLGERIADPVAALTAESLELSMVTNGSSGGQPSISWPVYWDRHCDVELQPPLMGVSQVSASVDQDGVCCRFSVDGSFRRGLAREESLRKIEALRKNVERECGFKLNDYSFSARGSGGTLRGGGTLNRGGLVRRLLPERPQAADAVQARARAQTADTVVKEGCGPDLWMDLDGVCAESVTTHGGMRVSIACSVNTTTENASGGIDSPVGVSVGFALVDVVRKAEDRADSELQLVKSRLAAAKDARITDIFGVEIGKPSKWPTNELEKASYETWSPGDNGEKKDCGIVHYWMKSIEDHTVPFIDRMSASYSFSTLRLCSVDGLGEVPSNVDRLEAIRRLDAFALELNKKYGIHMHRRTHDRGSRVQHSLSNERARLPSDANASVVVNEVQYGFSNEHVLLSLSVDFNAGKAYFELADLTARKAIRQEGWESKPE